MKIYFKYKSLHQSYKKFIICFLFFKIKLKNNNFYYNLNFFKGLGMDSHFT